MKQDKHCDKSQNAKNHNMSDEWEDNTSGRKKIGMCTKSYKIYVIHKYALKCLSLCICNIDVMIPMLLFVIFTEALVSFYHLYLLQGWACHLVIILYLKDRLIGHNALHEHNSWGKGNVKAQEGTFA